MTIGGGGEGIRRLMEKTILNFHFDYLNPSLIYIGRFSITSFSYSRNWVKGRASNRKLIDKAELPDVSPPRFNNNLTNRQSNFREID